VSAIRAETSHGVYVLGMHRSGTSLVAGLVDHLGIDGGPRDSMIDADQFNDDGYWEQRPLVDWHDKILARLRGWASAPPPPPTPQTAATIIAEFGPGSAKLIERLYGVQWFMKDPRMCLLLWLWTETRGERDLAVVVIRDADGVARSLNRRNGYSKALSVALWERYCHDVLVSLEGRPCVVLHYSDLTREPERWVSVLTDALDRHLDPRGYSFADRADDAISLVHRDHGARDGDEAELRDLLGEQRALTDLLAELPGYHECLTLPGDLPPLSSAGTRLLERRRTRLNLVRSLAGSSRMRARLDRLPAVMRDVRASRK
jgi:hypothetical protein